MTNIVAFSGHKSAGKDTCVNTVLGMYLTSLHVVEGTASVLEDGKLHVTDILGNQESEGILDVHWRKQTLVDFLDEYVHPYVKVYSFADPLKSICMQVLGLSYEQCYGTDEQKNEKTHLKWNEMPTLIDTDRYDNYMTGREVLQYVGTNLFREMSFNVWVDTTLRKIESEQPGLALINDCRFPNEVEGVQKAGGKVIHLTRNPIKDEHISETALDDYKGFDAIIDNANMSIAEQTLELEKILGGWKCIPNLESI